MNQQTKRIPTTNLKGNILYKFKGNSMSKESAKVVLQDSDKLTVERLVDKQIVDFVRCDNHWLLSGHTNSSSLLYGTQFILS
jgi:hypothetical protein